MAASRKPLLFTLALLCSCLLGRGVELQAGVLDFSARDLAGKVDRANAAFERRDYDEALKGYTDAQLSRPDSPELLFNIGDVHYRKGNFEEARKAFEGAAAASEDARVKAAAYYNLGNTLFRLGARKGDMSLFKEAIESYKKSLKIDPGRMDAKYNIEYIRRKLKENAKRSGGGNDRRQERKDDGKKDSRQGGSRDRKNGRKKDDERDKRDGRRKDERRKRDGERRKDGAPRKDGRDEKKTGASMAGDKDAPRTRLDAEQARRWLDRLKKDEKEQLERYMRHQGARRREVDGYDW